MVTDDGFDLVHEAEDIGGGRATRGNHEVGVNIRHRNRTNSLPLETEPIDDGTSVVTRRILEDTPRVECSPRLMILPPSRDRAKFVLESPGVTRFRDKGCLDYDVGV